MTGDWEEVAYRLAELERRVRNVVRRATVAQVDIDGGRVRCEYDEDEDGNPVLTGWLPWMTRRAGADADWWAPSVGEQVRLLAEAGELASAVALPASYSTAMPRPARATADRHIVAYADGATFEHDSDVHVARWTARDTAVIEHDSAAKRLLAKLPAGGTVRIEAPGGATIVADVRIEGDVDLQGSLVATGDVSDAKGSMDEMRDTYNTHTQPVAGGTASAPSQQMT